MLSMDGQITLSQNYLAISKCTAVIHTNRNQSYAVKRGGITTTPKPPPPDHEIATYLATCYKQEPIHTYQIPKPLEKLFRLAEEIQIIGEHPLKHWDKNQEYANIPIIGVNDSDIFLCLVF